MIKPINKIPMDGEPYRGILKKNTMNIIPLIDSILEEQLERELVLIGQVLDPIFICKSLKNPALFEILIGEVEYDIALRNDLPYSITIMDIDTKAEIVQFIISKHLLRVHLNRYQKGTLVLKHESKLIDLGRKHMSMGGKGINKSENLQPHNTNKILADMAGCSPYLLDQIKKINAVLYGDALKYKDMKKQLETDEISVNKAFELLFPKEVKKLTPANFTTSMPDVVNIESINPASSNDTEVQNELAAYKPTIVSKMIGDSKISIPFIADEVQVDSDNEDVTVHGPASKYHINTDKEYQVVYVRPKWNLTNQIILHDDFFADLNGLNVSGFTYNRYATLFILTPAKYVSQTIEIAKNWGFSYSDLITINMDRSMYKSNYADQISQYLLICEKDKVVAPNISKEHFTTSIISYNQIFKVIDEKFPVSVNKIGIFTEEHQGWDTYNIDQESKQMIKNEKLVAA